MKNTPFSIRLNVITKKNLFLNVGRSHGYMFAQISILRTQKKIIKLNRRCHWQTKGFEYLLSFFYRSAGKKKKRNQIFKLFNDLSIKETDAFLCLIFTYAMDFAYPTG